MPLVKRKLTNKSIIEKCKALKDLEKGMSNKELAQKYGVPKNTVSTWVKNKNKLLISLEKNGTKSKRKKLRSGNFENVDKAIFTWFISKRSQVPIDGTILKEKALKFAEALGELDFKASDCWFHNWKERSVKFCQILFNLNINRYTCTSIEFFKRMIKIQLFCSYF